jgi:uncharacterized cofD-like protein
MSNLTRVTPAHSSALKAPLRVVSIGGGTGLSTLLSGLKKYARGSGVLPEPVSPILDIVAVVTVSDDGGSSGRLRRAFDILPPGDIRNCMTALSQDEALLSQLFRYRFSSGRGLKGHSFGNLFLTAMHQITGDFVRAVRCSSEILAIRGQIFPATSERVTLEAALEDGTIIRGESKISKSKHPIHTVRLAPCDCEPLPETLEAIRDADLITLGPGSLFTSLIPNLLVSGIPEALEQSQAMKVYFVNLMWQPGETMHYTAAQHVRAVHAHAGRDFIDCVVINSAPIPQTLKRKYANARVKPVENDLEELEQLGIKLVTADLLGVTPLKKIRHDPEALAEVVIDLASRSRAHRVRRRLLATQQTRKVR